MLDLHPLSPGFGVEAVGVDLAQPLSDAAFAEHRARVLPRARCSSLRAQTLTPAQFLAFARRFGPPRAARDRPVPSSGRPEHPDPVQPRRRTASRSGSRMPARTSTPTIRTCSSGARDDAVFDRGARGGGNTLFANQYAAYDDLPDAMKRRIEPLLGIHHYGNRNDQDETSRTVASVLTDEQKAKMPLITHPLARPHPVTGRKALYAVSGSSFGIVGMPDDEARALLDELAAHATQPKYQLQPRVWRRRRRHLGQRVAAAFGDARRSRRSAHAVADHAEGAGAIGSRARA